MVNSKTSNTLKTVLVIATQQTMQEIVDLPIEEWGYQVMPMTIEEIAKRWPSPNGYVEWVVGKVKSKEISINGVIGTTDDASLITAMIARQLKLSAPSIASVLNCQQKYWSRQIQRQVVPEHTPEFALVKPNSRPSSFPIFIKPVKSRLSYFSHLIHNKEEFSTIVQLWHTQQAVNQKANAMFIQLFNKLPAKLRKNKPFQNLLIAEEYIDAPEQVTVDGYIFKGTVSFFGITRSDFVPETLSFNGFHYPYYQNKLPFKRRIESVVRKLIGGLKLDHTLFNVELKCDPNTGRIWIIEINSRMSQQFMYLIESVAGYHPLHAALDIAVGKRPVMRAASTIKRNNCCSCFILRRAEDAIVGRVPTPEEIQHIQYEFPGVRINVFVKKGERLSHHVGDAFTHRYGEVKVPAQNEQQARSVYKNIRKQIEPLFQWRNA